MRRIGIAGLFAVAGVSSTVLAGEIVVNNTPERSPLYIEPFGLTNVPTIIVNGTTVCRYYGANQAGGVEFRSVNCENPVLVYDWPSFVIASNGRLLVVQVPRMLHRGVVSSLQ
jgi:hypothetical protein